MSEYKDLNNTNCPYDGRHCQNKQDCMDELREYAFRCPELVVPYKTNLFAGCPIKSDIGREEICKRYNQYLANMKNNEQQH